MGWPLPTLLISLLKSCSDRIPLNTPTAYSSPFVHCADDAFVVLRERKSFAGVP